MADVTKLNIGGVDYDIVDASVPSWAKQNTKPTYTANEVGALPAGTHIPADQVQSNWNETNTSSKAYIQNKPTIPDAQVNSDWDASSGVAQILNKPTFKTINGESIVGTGDIEAGSGDVATAFTITITSTTIEVQPMTGALMTVGTDVSFQVV